MPDLLSVENVTKIYQKGQVPGLNKFREGEFVGIMGASGSGNTTLLNVLSTTDKPYRGAYTLGVILGALLHKP